jgi:AcrR family transcriptional regulator
MQNSDETSPRGRGRPRAFDREAALDKAMRLFWLKGYESTAISDLTAELGIGAPSLYAAFGPKEALYVEALGHYRVNFEAFVWDNFKAAATARQAVEALLMDSAAALTGSLVEMPTGCMVTLSVIDGQVHRELGELVRSARAVTLERLEARLVRAIAEGELPAALDVRALARFAQTVQNGMSLLARDGVCRAELEDVARVSMAAWDARVAQAAG